jgi:hypothetical protein
MEFDRDTLVKSLLSFILNDEEFSKPVYLNNIRSEKDADEIGMYPVIYIWNECKELGSFSVSVNTQPISHLLEGQLPRNHRYFDEIRDEVATALSTISEKSIISTCQKVGAFPSEVFTVQTDVPKKQKRKVSYY